MDGSNVAAAGEVVEVEAGVGFGPDGGDLGPDSADGVNFVEVRADGGGMGEDGIVAGDLAAVGDPDAAGGGGDERGGEALRGGAEGSGEGRVDAREGGRGSGRPEVGVDAVEEGLVGELVLGEAARGGGKVGGAEEGEEDGEDLRVAVDEDGARVGGSAVREREEERVRAARTERGERRLEELSAHV